VSSQNGRSYLWLLVLLPAGLGIGWAVGYLPGPAPKPAGSQVASAPAPAPVFDPVDGPPEGAPPAPVVETKQYDGPPAVVSSWTSFEGAMSESRSNGKPVLLDFNAEWCPPCQRMKRDLFENGAMGRAVQTAVILVSVVDRVRETGSNPADIEALQRQYGVQAFPTLVVFNPATGRSVATKGFGGAERTLAWIEEAARAVR
jgi:thiol-disulfide isomerase/thioredoxin